MFTDLKTTKSRLKMLKRKVNSQGIYFKIGHLALVRLGA